MFSTSLLTVMQHPDARETLVRRLFNGSLCACKEILTGLSLASLGQHGEIKHNKMGRPIDIIAQAEK